MNTRFCTLLAASVALTGNLCAAIFYQDDFTGASLNTTVWNNNVNSPASFDAANDQVDYVHTAGTSRRFLNYNAGYVHDTGYIKATISNFSGDPSIRIGFVGTSPGNNANYAYTIITGNGTYELFYNHSTSPEPFNNGNGWSGTLAAGTGLWSTDGGTTSTAITIGTAMSAASNFFGFGFANFGNGTVFPSSSFSIDSVLVADSLMVTVNAAPTVTITAPADGTTILEGTNVNFTGTATDAEDGNLDAAITWTSNLDGSIGGPGAAISTASFSPGTHIITASVTDSGSSTGNDAITITVNPAVNTPPTVKVFTPADRATVAAGVEVTFSGLATDAVDGDLSSNINWTSNIDGLIGVGASVKTSSLSIGTHTITASATDSGALTTDDSFTVFVISTAGAPRPNIIVIICDDAGYADFGFMDGLSGTTSDFPTPHLDALANRGVTFSRAYVAANCQPTRAAMVTGAYQARIGNESVGNNHYLDTQIFEGVPMRRDTVWDRMKNLGYTTGAIGKWHLGSIKDTPTQPGNRPQNQGIDEFYGFWHGSREYLAGAYTDQTANPDHALQLRYIREALIHPDGSKTDTVVEFSKFANVPTAPQYMTNILGDYAEQFVEDHHDDSEPFFLYVAHPAPHKPWSGDSPDYNDPSITGLSLQRRQVGSMMITMDKEIGDLMDQLDDPNGDGDDSDSIRDNTLVIFINDNGGVSNNPPGTSNGILNGWKGSPLDGGICVPMIMAGAGIDPSKQDTVYTNPVHGIDILPTAVELAGATLDAEEDQIDGVNLIPFVNGINPATPHDKLVHRWRGTFAVIDDNWKFVNTASTNANPTHPNHYRLYDLSTDRSETTNLISNAAHADRVAEMKRDLTDQEAQWDKPRYPILNNTLDTEPINIIDHFTFRPGLHNDWSAGVPDSTDVSTEPMNWFEGGTTNPENLFRSDGFCGAILEFPVHSASYTANNDLVRKTGMEFMLNKIILSGDYNDSTSRTASISGNDLLLTCNLAGEVPCFENTSTKSGPADFSFDVSLDLILYHDLTFGGDGTSPLNVTGTISEYFASRGLTKSGTCTAALNGPRTYSGDTTVTGGVLTLAQANANDDGASIHLADNGATLNLTFAGTDTVDKLFIGGVQQPAGVYEAVGNPAGNTEIAQITGGGTLTVTTGPGGYSQWSSDNAPGQDIDEDHDNDRVPNGIEYFMGESGSGFTTTPSPDASGTITWPMSASYLGVYATDYLVETSIDLDQWDPVDLADVSISPGSAISYTLPPSLPALFARLAVYAE